MDIGKWKAVASVMIEGTIYLPPPQRTADWKSVKIRLEIEEEVPDGLENAKVRTLSENANTLGFKEKSVE